MTTAQATAAPVITRPRDGRPIFAVTGRTALSVRAGASIGGNEYPDPTPVGLPDLAAGTDYAILIQDGRPVAVPASDGVPEGAVGGFHFAPGGNAGARAGGDAGPAINPCSIWDAGFRPACLDPRGMALVERGGLRFWCDIYLLGTEHLARGTSRFGETIADGDDRPAAPDGKGRTKTLDYPTAVAVYAHHGKRLLGAEEFFAAAHGVTERSAAGRDPHNTGLDAARTSAAGIMQATGNMWVWGTDGDPDEPRPSLFGGSWVDGSDAGSRYADLDYWPEDSNDDISARGRSDHLTLD